MSQRERTRRRLGVAAVGQSGSADSAGARSKPSIKVSIDELVLNGILVGEGQRIGEAFENELNRLLTEQGLPLDTTTAKCDRLDGGAISLGQTTKTATIGSRIAAAVYRGFASIGSDAHSRDPSMPPYSGKSNRSRP
jgi:hypothetical protein